MTSTDTPPSEAAAPAAKPGLSLVQKITYAGIAVVFGIIFLAKLITWGDLPGCDFKEARYMLSDIFKAKKVEATAYDEIKTISKSESEILCNARLSLKNNGKLEINYRLFKEDGKTKLVVTQGL